MTAIARTGHSRPSSATAYKLPRKRSVSGERLANASQDPSNHPMEWSGTSAVRGGSVRWLRFGLLTLSMASLQAVWGFEFSQCSQYLLSLGFSKSSMSLVWAAGPLSGLVMQPLIGVWSDKCSSRWGRRRPFMMVGSAICVMLLLMIGWTKELASVVATPGTGLFAFLSAGIAILSIYSLDFAVNAIQSTDRALIVDTLPQAEQSTGNAWAGVMQGAGSVVMFWIGNTDLVRNPLFSWIGSTQLKCLAVLSSAVLLLLQGLTSWAVSEKVLVHASERDSLVKVFKKLWYAFVHLPPAIRKICNIQFFCTVGWFPIMFFAGPVWVGETYLRNHLSSSADDNLEELQNAATRAGSRALFIHSLAAFIFSMVLPSLVETGGSKASWIQPVRGLSLPLLWMSSQALFCFVALITPLAKTTLACTVLLAILGFSLALTIWAPYSLVGEQIRLGLDRPARPSVKEGIVTGVEMRSQSHDDVISPEDRTTLLDGSDPLGGEDPLDISLEDGRSPLSEAEVNSRQAGVILGILNIYIVVPQFIVTLASSLIFNWLEPGQSEAHLEPSPEGPMKVVVSSGRAMTVILQLGGLSTGYAAILAYQFWREYKVTGV